MTRLDQMLAWRSLDADGVAAMLGVDVGTRRPVKGYGALRNVDVLEDKGRGIRFFLDGDHVALIYIGSAGLPAGTDEGVLAGAAGTDGELLRSRQGKTATLHVAARAGMAWSESDGALGWLELFDSTTLEDYRRRIYREPPLFVQ